MNIEQGPDQPSQKDKKNSSKRLRRAFFAGILSLGTGTAEAHHITNKDFIEQLDDPHAIALLQKVNSGVEGDLQGGLKDMFKKLALHSDVEWSCGFEQRADGRWYCVAPAEGEQGSVGYKWMEHLMVSQEHQTSELIQFHSHPVVANSDFSTAEKFSGARKYLGLENVDEDEVQKQHELIRSEKIPPPPYPPSWADMKTAATASLIVSGGYEERNLKHIIATPRGFWSLSFHGVGKEASKLEVLNILDAVENEDDGMEYESLRFQVSYPYQGVNVEKYLSGNTKALKEELERRNEVLEKMINFTRERGVIMEFTSYENVTAQ